MKFEEFYTNGKYYKTRNGKKVRIYALDGTADFMHVGFLEEHGWYSDILAVGTGAYYKDTDYESCNDIVGEWEEPKNQLNTLEAGLEMIRVEFVNDFKKVYRHTPAGYDELISTDSILNKCDCGALTAKTSHAHWCATNRDNV